MVKVKGVSGQFGNPCITTLSLIKETPSNSQHAPLMRKVRRGLIKLHIVTVNHQIARHLS